MFDVIAITPLLLAVLGLGAFAPETEPAPHTQQFHSRLGECRVTAFGPIRNGRTDTSASAIRKSGNAFLVERGRSSVLIAPISMGATERVSMMSGHAVPQAIVLTSLETLQPGALMEGGKPAYPNTSVFVDRALVDDPPTPSEAKATARLVLAAYHRIGRLRLVEPDADLLPGVRIAISPYKARSESRVRISCGQVTLMVLPAREVAFQATNDGMDRRDDRLPHTLASDAYVLALTDGAFPGIGRIYIGHDGYHWGTVAARALGGVPRRRGEVFVEAADEGAPTPAPTPVASQPPGGEP
ncbi:hypothetical protein [Sphingomonas glacialis]|uniref:Uncharacterized protein n=1 Tax=Sphingomonas glacialis TaxID=658225 RepID=A0A502FR73_9SPHN|nr:hypothetical protein [Sphingomonas glacialis]TPG52057.1 hypothetical protein EAH76_15165 [Sphingomonas glacialis]